MADGFRLRRHLPQGGDKHLGHPHNRALLICLCFFFVTTPLVGFFRLYFPANYVLEPDQTNHKPPIPLAGTRGSPAVPPRLAAQRLPALAAVSTTAPRNEGHRFALIYFRQKTPGRVQRGKQVDPSSLGDRLPELFPYPLLLPFIALAINL